MTAPLDPLVKLGRENERLKMANADLRSMNRKMLRRGGGYAVDEAIEEFKQLLTSDEYTAAFKPLVYEPQDQLIDLGSAPVMTLATAWSDWHLSERVRKEETNGFNEFSSVIAANRVWKLIDEIKRRFHLYSQGFNIIELWTLILGDMINGSIHADLAFTNDLTDPAAVVLCSRLIEMSLNELKSLNIPIHVSCVVGNHPRTTAKMPTKRQGHQSLDWLIYEIVAKHFRTDDQLTFQVETGQIGMRTVLGHRYLFEHGIDVKSGAEEDFESRLRNMYDDSLYREATKSKGTSFDHVVIGNMHKEKFLERTTVNGCLVGQGELGMSWRLKPIKASQAIWGITEEDVRRTIDPIALHRITSNKPTNPFSEYASWFMKRHGRQ